MQVWTRVGAFPRVTLQELVFWAEVVAVRVREVAAEGTAPRYHQAEVEDRVDGHDGRLSVAGGDAHAVRAIGAAIAARARRPLQTE